MNAMPLFRQIGSCRWTLPLCCAAPFALLAFCVFHFGVDVLFWDEWLIWSGFLRDLQTEGFSLQALAAQQNEQRNLMARLVGWVLMPFCRLDRFCEYGVMLLMALGIWLCVTVLWRRTRARLAEVLGPEADAPGCGVGHWLPALFALLCFSLQQWQVYAFGANTSIMTIVLCLLLGVLLLQGGRLEPWRVALVVLTGWAGSFHFANGLFYWLCLWPLLLTARAGRRARLLALGVFLLAGAAAWLLYFQGYVKPPHHPDLTFGLSRPLHLVGYFFTYLGGPLLVDENLAPLALLMGLGACVFAGGALLRLWREAPRVLVLLLPWLLLGLFALLSDAATALGRAGFGMHKALQSRYVPFSNLFWFALPVLWAVTRRLPGNKAGGGHGMASWQSRFLALALGVYLLGGVLSLVVFVNREAKLLRAKEALFSLAENAPLLGVFPDPNYLRKIVPLFFAPRLSVYREVGRLEDYRPTEHPGGTVEEVTLVLPGGEVPSGVLVRGRVALPSDLVLLMGGKRVLFAARPDASGAFQALLPADWFGAGEERLGAWAVTGGERARLRFSDAGGGADGLDLALPEAWYPPFVTHQYFYSK